MNVRLELFPLPLSENLCRLVHLSIGKLYFIFGVPVYEDSGPVVALGCTWTTRLERSTWRITMYGVLFCLDVGWWK